MKIRNVFDHWPACHKWTNDYLQQSLADTTLSVAVTPNGMYFMCKLKMIMHETIYILSLIGSRDLFVMQLLYFSKFNQSANCLLNNHNILSLLLVDVTRMVNYIAL